VRLSLRSSALSIVSLSALAACSTETPTSPTGVRPRFVVQPVTQTICSSAAATGWVAEYNAFWGAPILGSEWIVPVAGYGSTAPALADHTLDVNLPAIPAGATNISLSGTVMADNALIITLNAAASANSFGAVAPYSANNFQVPVAFGTNSDFNAGGANVLRFRLINEDVPPANASLNPMGLDYCFDLTYTEAPPPEVVAIFVIGDNQPHAVGDNANFWGAQWWQNNTMTGEVSNGVAAFKGYATLSDNACGGTWTSLPGNSSNPPASISDDIAVIVTSTVLKDGPNISGDIKQILMVHHDGNYSDNPGHAGNGLITSVVCTAP